MRLRKVVAIPTGIAAFVLIATAPAYAQQGMPTQNFRPTPAPPPSLNKPLVRPTVPDARDHRTSQPVGNVRDHRQSSPGIVSATGSGVKQGVTKAASAAVTPVRNLVNTASKTGSGLKDLATGRPIKGAKKLASAGVELGVAPVRTAVNAGSKVVGGVKKVGSAAKSVAKKLNPFD
jgi:hypothetical protein